MASNEKNTKGFNLAGNNKKYGFNTVPNDSVSWHLQTADGKSFGNVSYGAYKAIKDNTLDSYTPKNDNEKKAISDFTAYAKEQYDKQQEAEKQKRINSNPTFARYNIDPADFDFDDLTKWAGEHNQTMRVNSSTMSTYYTPKYEGGFLGIGGKKLSTDEEDADLEVLYQTAANNERAELAQKDLGAFASAMGGFYDGATLGAVTPLADWSAKKQYEDAGLDSKTFISPSQAHAKTVNEHVISGAIGDIAGSLLSMGAVGKAVSAATKGIKLLSTGSKVANIVKPMLDSGLTFAIVGGAEEAISGGDYKDVIKEMGIDFASGVAGSAAGQLTAKGLSSVLTGKLSQKFISKITTDTDAQDALLSLLKNSRGVNIAISGLSGAAFSTAKTGTSVALRNDEQITGKQLAIDAAVAFLASSISYWYETENVSAKNKKYVMSETEKIIKEYEQFRKDVVNISKEQADVEIGQMRNRLSNLYTFFKNNQFVGSGKEVANVLYNTGRLLKGPFAIEVSNAGTGEPTATNVPISLGSGTTPGVTTGATPKTSVPPVSSASANVPTTKKIDTPVNVAEVPQSVPNVVSSPVVDGTTPIFKNTNDFTDELSEVASAGAVEKMAPETASGEIKKLDNRLIADGADDASRKEIVEAALEIEKALAGSGKTIRSVFDNVSKITNNAITEIKNKAGATNAYWNLFKENFKAVKSGNITENTELVTEYASAYSKALKNSYPEIYNSVFLAADGSDLSSELPHAIMGNVIPENVQNADKFRSAVTQIKNIVSAAGAQISNERAEIYGAKSVSAVPTAENTGVVSEGKSDSQINAQTYNIVVSELKRKAEELGLLDENFFTALQNVNLYNPTENDRALISSEFHRIFANNTDPLVKSCLDFIDSANPQTATHTNPQNTNDTKATDAVSMYDQLEKYRLTYDEQSAILNYKSIDSYIINNALRNGDILDSTQKSFVNMLNSALDKFPVYRGTVYRNIGFDNREDFDSFIQKHQNEKSLKYNAFTSASKSVDGYIVDMPYTVNYEIYSHDGKDISEIGILDENEVLFKSGTEFGIRLFEVRDNEIKIRCEELKNDGTKLQSFTGETRNKETSNGNAEQNSLIRTRSNDDQGLDSVRERSASNDRLLAEEPSGERGRFGGNGSSDSVELRTSDRYDTRTQGVLQRQDVTGTSVGGSNADLADGEILSLKHTKNVYSLFKGAGRVIVGKDVIADGFVAIPLTDEALAGVKKVAGDVIQENPNLSLSKFYHKSNDVVIQGDPKAGEMSTRKKTEKAYVFKIGDAFYICQQKFIDAFNNGKNVITANKNVKIPWNVHNENGEFVALFLGVENHAMNNERFNSLPSVSDIISADRLKKAESANNPFNQNEVRQLIGGGIPFFSAINGSNYIGDGHIFVRCNDADAEFINNEYRKAHADSNFEIETKEEFGQKVEKNLSEAKYLAEATDPISYIAEGVSKRAANAYVVGDYAILFNKDHANLIKKRSSNMRIISNGSLSSTLLIGYDADGNVTGFALPIYAEGEATTKDGKTVPFVKGTDINRLVKEAPATVERKSDDTSAKKEDVLKNELDNTTIKSNGTKQIAGYVAAKLEKGEKITALELSKISSEAFGGTMADNAYSIKDAYDAMELGVNKHILSMKNVSAEKMLDLLELLPTQTKRTEEMVKFQQFSTPPSIAYLANFAANVNSNDIMLEPSAGIGGIAVFAKKDGAAVYVNELDDRRLKILKNMPFDGFFNENAEQLDNILGGKIEPTVIVMNPPFSSSSERNIQNTKIGAKHIEQALKILAPNGRLVAIVGNGMSDGAPAFRTWWKDIKSQYNVRANIGVNGKNYNKYGTNFDIQMLVIDKNGPTTQTETGYVDTLQELQEKLGGIRNERPAIDYSANEQRLPANTRAEAVTTGETADIGNSTVSDTGSLTNNGRSSNNANFERQPERKGILSVDTDSGKPAISKTENTNVVAGADRGLGTGQQRGLVENQNTAGISDGDSGQSDIQTRRDESRKRLKRKELTDSIFEHYQTHPLLLKNTQPHPAKVSESAAMSAIDPPAITYRPAIPQSIVENGVLSDVQLEAISYAGQSHSQTLPDGTTRGFFLGDGTGIGKGRTIAGMILDNYNQGRKKSLWVTLNSSLVNDAKRDVKALFGNSDLVTQFVGGNKANSVLNGDEAIMVISYSALSKDFNNTDSNFEKIVKWLGKDFDGLIVFDESHKMGNATAVKGTRGIKKASQTGLAGIALQKALPKAKIVYSSATGATEVENLRYAERLGLWGDGTAFVTGDDFVNKIKAGGLAAMELIARDMKAMGVYLSRNISYEDVQYGKIIHNLTNSQKKIYDELARSWQIVLNNINKALDTTNQSKDGNAKGRALGAFWSSQQRFFNQILTSMQVPSVISDIEKQLADGKSCVIQLVSTNEAAQNEEFERLKAEDLELEEFDLTPKQMLMSYIENSFPVQQFEEYRDDDGNVRSKPVYDSTGNPVMNREAVKQRENLLAKLGSIKVPSSPIDMIINHFGTDLVAENTGRTRRVIQKDGKFIEEKIGSKKDADVDAFQNGKKRIIIFSKAGGTGKSYHADKSAKNQQQRVHYLLEAGWQADNAVQGFGRSHRSNQASAPIFKLVTTDLKGQMRFISTIAKRLDQLGAMTKGQRQAGGQGMFSASDNLENSFAADVLAVFYKDLIANKVDGIDNGLAIVEKLGLKDKILDEYNRIKVTSPELRDVNKFLNRILSLESSEQNAVFDGYSERLQDATEKAMLSGTLDKGLENYKADKITVNEVRDIREDEKSGAKTKYYNLTAEHKIKPVKFKDIATESKSFVGFYQNRITGTVRAVMQTSSTTDQYGNVTANYKLVGQVKNDYIAQNRFYGNWSKIEPAEAEKLWNDELSKLPEYRKEALHLISGVVLPVWDKLPTENVRIYRVLTSDGDMLIGRVIPEDMIDETLRRLGSSRTKEKIATKDLVAGIKNGDTVHLENGWKIVQRKVSGENRIEVVGPSYEHYDYLAKKGVFTERIQYNTRYFVPANTNTEKIIDEILKLSPVMRVENAKYSIIESEGLNDEQTGSNILPGNGGRTNNASAGKQAERISDFKQKIKGKTKAERQSYAKELLAKELTSEQIDGTHKYNLVKPEAYNEDMQSIVAEAKKDGKEVGFFVGPALRKFDGQRDFLIDGIKVSNTKILLRYDGYYSPQTLLKHEDVHILWNSPEMQKAKDIILNGLSDAEKERLLSDGRYKDYMDLYKDDTEAVWEEFVADVFAGMNDYTADYIDIVADYWHDRKVIDRYSPAEYNNIIDAGGRNASVLDNVGFGNDNLITESGDNNGSKNSEALAGNGTGESYNSIWERSNDSKEIYKRVGSVSRNKPSSLGTKRGFIDWCRGIQPDGLSLSREKERCYGIFREISKRGISTVDSEGRELSAKTREYFANTVFKNKKGELIPLFHATDNDFHTFEFGDFGFHVGSAEQAIKLNKEYIKELYVNITNPFYIPVDRGIWPAFVVAYEANEQGVITQNEYDLISKMEGFHDKSYKSKANVYLRKLLKSRGYDGIIYNNGYEGEGISAIAFDSNQLKYVSNNNPSKSPDTRYALNTYDNDAEELTPERKKQIFEQFEKDRAEVEKPTLKQLWGERAAWVAHNVTRVFPNIPERGERGTFFAEFRKSMIQWKNLPSTASFMVQDKLNKMTEGLTPKEFKTFSELVYFLDLQEEAQIQKDKGYTEILLPNKITPNEVDSIVKVLNEEATQNVRQALIRRQNIWEALKTQYIDLNRYIGFDTDGKFKRKNYYHHQVIEYMNSGGKGTGSREIGIKAGRGWLKERQGSTKAINTDFLAVEYMAMLQMQYDVYIAETLGRIKKQYDIKPQLEDEAFRNNKKSLNEIIRKEATDKNGNVLLDSKGRPDSETYRRQMWYNSRIMFGFDGLFDLADRNELPTYDGEYAKVVEALKRHDLNVSGLYKYVGTVASTDLPDNATDAQEQAVMNARTVMKYTSQKKAWIKSVLADNYQTWETIAKSMSDTYTIHQPRRGNYFYTKEVIDEDAFNKAYNDMVLALASGDVDLGNTDINNLFAQYSDTVRLTGAAYEQWVLPNEIVATMNEIANPKQASEGTKIARSIVSDWKGWATSVNPLRTVKFGLRNLFGDLDAVIAGNPKIVMYSKKAVQDIYQAMRHKKYSPEYMEWIERGGYTSMIFANEMDSEMQDKLFSHLKEKQGVNVFKIPIKMFEKYYDGVENVHNFREAILRYSAYLYFKEAIKRNGGTVKDYVASNKYIVRGLNTVEDKAYQLSKDLLGAYDEVGKLGQTLRKYWIPFYSFTETNLKRYYRLFENIITSDDKIPKKAGKLLLKALMVNMLGLLMAAWNRLVMKDADDKLPPSARNVPHLTLGMIGDRVYCFRQLGSFSELLEWFGLDDYKWTTEDLTAPLDKAWGMVTPFLKMPIELVSGLNFYPSLTHPRAIRDKWQHFFNSFGVDEIYDAVTGKPTRGAGEILKSAFIYSYDYKESAYYEILDIKREYQGKTDNTIYGIDAKSNALYYMKMAVRYKDKEAALKYLDEYFENGGTVKGIKQSFATLNPMYGFTSKDTMEKGEAFIASLTEDQKEKLKIAQDYYENDLMLPENVLALLGKKDITDEEAKNVMKGYINAKCK